MSGHEISGSHPSVANDDPFEEGDRVSIIRARHGWHNGQTDGTVTRRWQAATGTWKYTVTDDEGNDHDVAHTRDLRSASGPAFRR